MIGMIRGRLTSILRHAGICGAALLLFVGTTGCQTSGSSANTASPTATTTNAKHVTVQLQGSAFSPTQIHVTPGTTVTWKNDDEVTHTVTSGRNGKPDGMFDSKDLTPGKSFSYTFKKSGTYPYYCVYHPNMVGTVIVSSSSATTTSGGGDMSGKGSMDSNAASTTSARGAIAPLGTGSSGEPKLADDMRLLPYKMENGYKVFHLTAQPVYWEVKPGQKVEAWAYNGTVPGPEIRVDQGDKVKIEVTNKLTEGTTVHWHGLDVPFKQDGSGGISQPDIKPGQTWTYTFTVNAPPGTYMYHAHPMKDMLKQEQMGLFGAFIVEPKGTGWKQVHPGYQDEYTLIVNDSPQFGYTINGLSYPATPVMPVKLGDKVLVHLINIGSMDHPMHLHGFHFQLINQDGWPLSSPQWLDTINTAPGSTYDLAFTANQKGKWLFHCHITEHVTDGENMSGMVTMFNVQ